MRQIWEELGQFWLMVFGAITVRYLMTEETTPPASWKQKAAAVLSGVLCAWFGTWPIVDQFLLSQGYVPIVAGLLALTGREIVAVILKRGPEIISGLLDAVVSKATATFNLAVDSWARDRTKQRPEKQEDDDENRS